MLLHADSVLYNKVISKNGKGQSAQIRITLVAALSTYIGKEKFSYWAESICNDNTRKTRADFMPTDISRSCHGTFNSYCANGSVESH